MNNTASCHSYTTLSSDALELHMRLCQDSFITDHFHLSRAIIVLVVQSSSTADNEHYDRHGKYSPAIYLEKFVGTAHD